MEVFMDSTHTFIQIHPKDNTAVALTSLKKDSVLNLDGRMYTLLEDIPQGHKFALEKISAGSAVIKYGSPIGNRCHITGKLNIGIGIGPLLVMQQKIFRPVPGSTLII